MCAHDHPVTLVGIVDADRAGEEYYGLPVRGSLKELGSVDVVIVTSLVKPDLVFRAMEQTLGPGRVLAPQMLSLAPKSRQARQPVPARAAE